MIPKYLKPLLATSVVKQHKRGMRRYFPITSKDINSNDALDEAIFILTGKTVPEDALEAKFNRGIAILHFFDFYLEEFDNIIYVRTICVEE